MQANKKGIKFKMFCNTVSYKLISVTFLLDEVFGSNGHVQRVVL